MQLASEDRKPEPILTGRIAGHPRARRGIANDLISTWPLGCGIDRRDARELPLGPDGKARAGKGYIWRIVQVDKVQRSLVLAFEQPHPEMTEAE